MAAIQFCYLFVFVCAIVDWWKLWSHDWDWHLSNTTNETKRNNKCESLDRFTSLFRMLKFCAVCLLRRCAAFASVYIDHHLLCKQTNERLVSLLCCRNDSWRCSIIISCFTSISSSPSLSTIRSCTICMRNTFALGFFSSKRNWLWCYLTYPSYNTIFQCHLKLCISQLLNRSFLPKQVESFISCFFSRQNQNTNSPKKKNRKTK